MGGAALLYLFGFTAMCVFVKEGQYPPPPKNVGGGTSRMAAVRTFFTECFTHKFYWLLFTADTCLYVSLQCNTFASIRNRDALHMTLKELGNIGFWSTFFALFLQYPGGWLSDKFSPVRVFFVVLCVNVLSPLTQCIWCFTDFGHDRNWWLLVILNCGTQAINIAMWAAYQPMGMKLLPKARYGQFASANAMMRALGMAVAAAISGVFMDVLTSETRGLGVFGYRCYPFWQIAFLVPAIYLYSGVYREWKARGGEKSYVPPEV